MTRITGSTKKRFLLIALGLVSGAYPFLHRALGEAHIYDIRWAGGLHSSDILQLHWAAQLATYSPGVVVVALVLSFFRPSLTGALLTVCVGICFLCQLLFLVSAVFVIVLNVPAPSI